MRLVVGVLDILKVVGVLCTGIAAGTQVPTLVQNQTSPLTTVQSAVPENVCPQVIK